MKTNGPWQILTSRIVYQSPFLRVREDKVIRPDGKLGLHNVVDFGNGIGSVSIAAVTEEREIYLVHQYRYAYGGFTLELVNGGIDGGELRLAAAKRELAEEAGLGARRWKKLGETFVGTESMAFKTFMYLARDLFPRPQAFQGENRMSVVKVPLRKAKEWARSGRIQLNISALQVLLVCELLNEY